MARPTEETLGLLISLGRYPVKSMLAEELNGAEVGERVVLGDEPFVALEFESKTAETYAKS